jgi:hypothetical protein
MVPSILEIVLADTTLPFQKKSPSPSNEKHDTHSSSVRVEYYRAMPTGMKAVDFERRPYVGTQHIGISQTLLQSTFGSGSSLISLKSL